MDKYKNNRSKKHRYEKWKKQRDKIRKKQEQQEHRIQRQSNKQQNNRQKSDGQKSDGQGTYRNSGNKKIIWAVILIVIILTAVVTAVIYGGSLRSKLKKIDGFTPYDTENPAQNIVLSEKNLTLDAIGLYSGKYVEDGSDDELQDVVAALFTNHSEKMLQIAEIEIKVGDDTALFRITNIPAGASVFAQDLNRLKGTEGQKASYSSEGVRYFEEVPMEKDKFDTEGTDGRLTLKNKTTDTYPCVYVYYKTQLNKDIYLGGITYRVPFEEVPGETQVDSDAGHFSEKGSDIVEIQVLEEFQSDIIQKEE